MNKIFITAIIIGFSQYAMAQQPDIADVKEVMILSGVNDQYDIALDQVIKMIPDDKQTEFKKDFQAVLDKNMDIVANIWMKYYSKADIAELKKFYNSPIGNKMKENNTKITKEVVANQQELMLDMQQAVMKYFQ